MSGQISDGHRERKEHVHVVFQPNGRQGKISAGTNLLRAAQQLGVEIESICGGHQTCGKCKVVVEEGDFPKFGVISQGGPPDRAGRTRAGICCIERLCSERTVELCVRGAGRRCGSCARREPGSQAGGAQGRRATATH